MQSVIYHKVVKNAPLLFNPNQNVVRGHTPHINFLGATDISLYVVDPLASVGGLLVRIILPVCNDGRFAFKGRVNVDGVAVYLYVSDFGGVDLYFHECCFVMMP